MWGGRLEADPLVDPSTVKMPAGGLGLQIHRDPFGCGWISVVLAIGNLIGYIGFCAPFMRRYSELSARASWCGDCRAGHGARMSA